MQIDYIEGKKSKKEEVKKKKMKTEDDFYNEGDNVKCKNLIIIEKFDIAASKYRIKIED